MNDEADAGGSKRGDTALIAAEVVDEVIQIAGPLSDDYELGRPVEVRISPANDEYVADIEELNLHAFGVSREEALRNVRARIVSRHLRLQQLSDRLSPAMEELARLFRTVVLPRHA